MSASSDAILPIGVPDKYTSEGVVQSFPGNTILCHIPTDSPIIPRLQAVYDAYTSHPELSRYVHCVPPASWHMTVFDGVRDIEHEPNAWPSSLEKMSLAEVTANFAQKLRTLGQQLVSEGLQPPFRMRTCGLERRHGGMGIAVQGATPEEDRRLRSLRDRLADTLGFKASNHDVYGFHVTVAYLLLPLAGEDKQSFQTMQATLPSTDGLTFELGRLEFCTFGDMEAYPRLFYLGEA
ncbi:hypothetical protein BAUCODRAFT_29427 [Baudoinia panamericana UAMH 10762]|uniref:DUF1868 domain-containing protein n=1 Tax=Baudoinia panamericana (strain UAMH 10762) TaxID=717646 RepID=M2MVQ8_BAUPA|nr:uncharacterized protein BAUCODRAFT_29427 [Baudoinia panamericana UAMH 10762]EMD01047.1 hypothetical protein BAUCODRAFT_29427 [Baudoinia panamericana UAMH 10762]